MSNLAASLYCPCRHPVLCDKCGKPQTSRDDTKSVLRSLLSDGRPPLYNVYGNGPILLSDIPRSCVNQETKERNETMTTIDIVLGIDEAGRGSVLGPMTYGMAFWCADKESKIPKDFNDSKQLNEEKRDKLFETILNHEDIGFAIRTLLPSEISRNMLRKSTDVYNLNEMSHDTAICMIKKLDDALKRHNADHNNGVDQKGCLARISTAYIDTVGNPAYYKRKLEREFPDIQFVVESKADANYPPCSAASVVAKVSR